jgi:hypothetical protein
MNGNHIFLLLNTLSVYKIESDLMPGYWYLFEIGFWEFWRFSRMQLCFFMEIISFRHILKYKENNLKELSEHPVSYLVFFSTSHQIKY